MNNIAYEGLVTVKLYNGKKLLSTKTYHNSGSQNLFKFLSQCLAGNYKTAEQLRPCMLKLFNFNGTPTIGPSTWTWTAENMVDASAFINISSSTEVVPVEATEDTEATYSAILHFRVPYSYILQNKVYVVAVYPNTTLDNNEYIAYYKLRDSTAETDQWDPINVDAGGSNSNVVIDWTMTFNNKASN